MRGKVTKRAFLERVVAATQFGVEATASLMTTDDFARENVRVACEALQLGLVRLHWEFDGYELRITRAGRLVARGHLEQAAATLESGTDVTRLPGDAPDGLLGSRLYPGSAGIHLDSLSARKFAPEIMRGVATGHLVVADGEIHALPPGEAARATWASKAARLKRYAGTPPAEEPATGLPTSRAGRYVSPRT